MTPDALTADREQAVETFITDWLSQHRIPGAALAIVDGESTYAEGFGARTLETNTPVTPETLFGVGSCTKPVTAVAVMQLVEAGDLSLDESVDAYLPHLADVPGDPITIAELLSHTSGMPSDGSALPLIGRYLGGGSEVPLSSKADFRRHVQGSVDHRVTDRDELFYYNSGYVMLGQIIEAVTGKSFTTHVEEAVLAPLGMERATFDRDAFEGDADRMTPYIKQDEDSSEAGFPFDPFIQPAGGLLSSMPELAGFATQLLGGGAVGDGEEALLTAESVTSMTTPIGEFERYIDGTELGYGYGMIIEPYLGDRLVGHGGSIGVSNAWFGYLEEADVGLALACTTSPETHPMSAGRAVLALLQSADPERVQPHYRLMSALEAVTGEYTSYRNIMQAEVERISGGLRLEIRGDAGDQELLLVPDRIDDDVLVCTTATAAGMQQRVRFDRGDDGVELFYERHKFTGPT